jgi:hypothetical protein
MPRSRPIRSMRIRWPSCCDSTTSPRHTSIPAIYDRRAIYCRLAPTVSQSGALTRQGKNRRQGNRLLKWAFSEAAQMAVQRYPQIREPFHRLLKRKKKRILAKSILAHKLAVAAFHVLHDEEPCRPGFLTG